MRWPKLKSEWPYVIGMLVLVALAVSDCADASLQCGPPPPPPPGCEMVCLCDEFGDNCEWGTICE